MGQFVVSIGARDRELFVGAAKWLARFYADVDVIIDESSISLTSNSINGLEQVWGAALTNERDFDRNRDRRRQLIDRLLS